MISNAEDNPYVFFHFYLINSIQPRLVVEMKFFTDLVEVKESIVRIKVHKKNVGKEFRLNARGLTIF